MVSGIESKDDVTFRFLCPLDSAAGAAQPGASDRQHHDALCFFGIALSLFYPAPGRENLSAANLLQKGVSAVLIAIGVELINRQVGYSEPIQESMFLKSKGNFASQRP